MTSRGENGLHLISRLPTFLRILGGAAALGCSALPAAAQYVLGTPNGTLNNAGWALDGSNHLSGFSAAVTNPANFGPGGTVHSTVTVSNLAAVDAGTLAGVNGFIAPWIANAQASSYQAAVPHRFSQRDGSLGAGG